jgi:hypothetical protein
MGVWLGKTLEITGGLFALIFFATSINYLDRADKVYTERK